MRTLYWTLINVNVMGEILAESMACSLRRNAILAETNEDPR
jgi:hypothetical protein